MDVERASDLYAEGWTLRQIGGELGVPWTAVSQQLRGAGVTMRRGGPSVGYAAKTADNGGSAADLRPANGSGS